VPHHLNYQRPSSSWRRPLCVALVAIVVVLACDRARPAIQQRMTTLLLQRRAEANGATLPAVARRSVLRPDMSRAVRFPAPPAWWDRYSTLTSAAPAAQPASGLLCVAPRRNRRGVRLVAINLVEGPAQWVGPGCWASPLRLRVSVLAPATLSAPARVLATTDIDPPDRPDDADAPASDDDTIRGTTGKRPDECRVDYTVGGRPAQLVLRLTDADAIHLARLAGPSLARWRWDPAVPVSPFAGPYDVSDGPMLPAAN
jgi:hypothetical protein